MEGNQNICFELICIASFKISMISWISSFHGSYFSYTINSNKFWRKNYRDKEEESHWVNTYTELSSDENSNTIASSFRTDA